MNFIYFKTLLSFFVASGRNRQMYIVHPKRRTIPFYETIMADKPKFLFCKNPMAEPEGVYVLHTQFPRFLAKLIGRGQFEIVDDIDSFANFDTTKKQHLLKRLNNFYIAFKKHNDELN